jgi:hypothetical protein
MTVTTALENDDPADPFSQVHDRSARTEAEAQVQSSTRSLRIGVMLDSLSGPRWVGKVIGDISRNADLDLALVVVDADAGGAVRPTSWREWLRRQRAALPHRLWEWYEAADYRRFRHEGEDPFATVDLAPLLGRAHVLTVSPLRGRLVDRFQDEDIGRIRQADLDVMIRFGFRIIKGDILGAARYGVWSIHHGDNRKYRGGPALFWEMYERNPESGTVLQVLTDQLDGGRVIYRSTSGTNFASLHKNRRETYWKTAEFITRRLMDLKSEGWPFLERLDTYQEPDTYARGIYRRPTNVQMARFLARTAAYRLEQKLVGMLDSQWVVAIRPRSDRSARYTIIDPPAGRFFADPFLAEDNGRTDVFFEDYAHRRRRGVIACAEIHDGKAGEVTTVLECDYHLSYPFVFRWRDTWWMVPETSEQRTVELYRARRFPPDWVLETTLLRDLDACDATLLERNGRWWMFATVRVPGGPTTDELSLYYADSLFGPWQGHPRNPVISDVRHARSAGAIFCEGDALVRPAQDCSRGYGHAITLNRIDCLTEREYRETTIGTISPTWARRMRATHTLARTDRYEALDARLLRWRLTRE